MMQCELIPVLAGIDDWLQFLVPAVFVIIWIISQVMGAAGQKPAPPPRRQQPRPPKPAGGLAQEIDAFLKQVQQARGAEQAGQRPAAAPQQRAQPVRVERQPEQLVQPLRPDIVEAELVEPLAPSSPPSKPLSQRRSRPQPELPRRTARAEQQKADRVDLADEKMAAHMQQVFGHELGALADTSDAIHEKAESKKDSEGVDIPTTSHAVRDILAQPASVRQAVILSEILRRPQLPW
jgi:hypothetical protein